MRDRREHYRVRHGYAVSIGVQFAALLSRNLGHADDAFVARHARVFGSVGLPLTYDPSAWDELRATMSLDKKTRGGALRFVLLDAVGAGFIAEAPDETNLRETYAELTASAETISSDIGVVRAEAMRKCCAMKRALRWTTNRSDGPTATQGTVRSTV